MKNKKGFTLVEIIAVIALIAVIVGIFIVNLVGKNDPKENNKDTVKQILSAADAYVSANKSEIEKLYEGYNFVDITIGDLKNNGLLSEDIINKETNEKYKDDVVVRVTLNDATKATEFELDPEDKDTDNTYLVADTIYLEYDASGTNWCNGENEFKGLNNADPNYGKLVLTSLDEPSRSIDLFKDDTIKVKSCNVDVTKAGTYSVVYTYTYNGVNVDKTRTVYVAASATDVDSFTANLKLNGVVTNKINLGATDVNIFITLRYKNGTSEEIDKPINEVTDFTIKGFATEPVGNKTAIVSYNKTNSDGSVPSPVNLDYMVSDELVDFIGSDCTLEPGKTDECYYRGEVETNYLKYENSSYMFRIYYRNGNGIKVIANDPYSYTWNGKTSSDLVYGMIGACKYSGCCNGGRYYYQGLGGTNYGSSFNYPTMSNIVNHFYTSIVNGSPKYVDNQYITGAGLGGGAFYTKVALMSKNDYTKVANCNGNNCFRSYLTNNSNAGKDFWLVETVSFTMDTSNFNYGRSEAYVYNNYVDASTFVVDEGGSYKGYTDNDFYTTNVTYDTNKVRPTLQLKNAKIVSGNGTKANPFIVR